MLRAEVFGGLRFVVDGGEVEVRGAQRCRIAALLLVDAGRVVPTRRLVDALDPDARSTNPLNAVQAHVGRLRRVLEPGTSGRSARRLRSVGDGYVLEPDEFDLWEYRAEVAAATEELDRDPCRAVHRFEAALAAWADPFGPLGDDPTLAAAVEVVRYEHLDAEDAWADAVVRSGATPAGAGALLVAARREPIRERRAASAMQALAQVGRQSDALRLYDHVRTVLRDELGVDPGEGLCEMHRRVLEQDPGLRNRAPTLLGDDAPTYLDSFVGRSTELEQLAVALERHRVVTVTGMAGVGKTRLARELLARSASPRVTTAAWVPVGREGEALGVADSTSAALGFGRAERELSPARAAAVALPDGEFLLVLDGAEARFEECRHTLLTLLRHRPGLRVVVTSQVPLALPDEAVLPLAPLAVPADDDAVAGTAVELARDRLGGIGSLDAARAVARTAGGIPLAVEVAARRPGRPSGSTDPGALSDPRDGDLLASVIGSSVMRVSPEARRLLRLATLLPDGLSSEAAEWTAGTHARPDEPDPWAHQRLLDELTRASLLATRATSCTTMHTPPNQVTDAVRSSMDARTRRAARDDAVGWLVRLSGARDDELLASPDPRVQQLLCDEGANVEVALQHCCEVDHPGTVALACAVVPHLAQLDTPHRPRDWIRMVRTARPLEPYDDARLVIADVLLCADLASIAGRHDEIERARSTLDGCGRREGSWWLTASLVAAIARGWTGDLEGAGSALGDARRAAGDDEWHTALVDRYQSLFDFARGDAAAALTLAIDTAERFSELGDPAHALGTSFYAIMIARAVGDPRLGALIERAVSHPAAERYPISSLVLAEAAQAARLHGEDGAEQMLRAAIIHLERHGFVRSAATTRRDLGLMLLERGERDAAATELRAAAEWLVLLDPMGAGLAVAGLAASATDAPPRREALIAAAWDLVATNGTPPTEQDLQLLSCLTGSGPRCDTVTGSRRAAIDTNDVLELLR